MRNILDVKTIELPISISSNEIKH